MPMSDQLHQFGGMAASLGREYGASGSITQRELDELISGIDAQERRINSNQQDAVLGLRALLEHFESEKIALAIESEPVLRRARMQRDANQRIEGVVNTFNDSLRIRSLQEILDAGTTPTPPTPPDPGTPAPDPATAPTDPADPAAPTTTAPAPAPDPAQSPRQTMRQRIERFRQTRTPNQPPAPAAATPDPTQEQPAQPPTAPPTVSPTRQRARNALHWLSERSRNN